MSPSKFYVTVFSTESVTLIESHCVDSLEQAFKFVNDNVLGKGKDEHKDCVYSLRVNRGVITQATLEESTAAFVQREGWYHSLLGQPVGTVLIQSRETALKDLQECMLEGNDCTAQAKALAQ